MEPESRILLSSRPLVERTRGCIFATGFVSGLLFTLVMCMLLLMIWQPHSRGSSAELLQSIPMPGKNWRKLNFSAPELPGSNTADQALATGEQLQHSSWQRRFSPCSKGGNCSWCSFGTLPGIWHLEAPPGGRWQLLSPLCRLGNLLPIYTSPIPALSGHENSTRMSTSVDSRGQPLELEDSQADGVVVTSSAAAATGSEQDLPLIDETAAAAPLLPAARTARILFLSDSVDKYILTHLCGAAQGTVRAVVTKTGSGGAAGGGAAPGGVITPFRSLARNISSYVVHICKSNAGLRLVATYLPGVHPTGPYHRMVTQTYKQRIDRAVAVWKAHSPNAPPQVVATSSLLWDVARMHAWEPALVSGEELAPSTLQSWAENYTAVVKYAMKALPEAKLFAFHTTLPPRHHPETGRSEKPYLGRRVYVDQLNAAGRAVALSLGMEVIDYEQVGSRFREGQAYLVDQIHPGPLVGLEIANVYLNYAQQLQAGRHPPA